MSVFDGTQPTFTHVPPRVPASMMAALKPRSAARIAAAKAAEPPPTIAKSSSDPSSALDSLGSLIAVLLLSGPLTASRSRRAPPCGGPDLRAGGRVRSHQ